MIGGQRLLFICIDHCTEKVLAAQCIDQGLFIHDSAASHVHDDRLLRQSGNFTFADHACGLVCKWRVQCKDVRLLEQTLQRVCFVGAQCLEPGLCDVRIVGNHAHAESTSTSRNLTSNPPKADYTERSSLELRAQ